MCSAPYARAHALQATGSLSIDDLPGIFGVPSLHDHQQRAIETVAGGRDLLLIVPTGGGKSFAFWGAGLLAGGLTLVESPLRSLMADQFRRLESLGIPARLWNSDVRDDYKAETLRLIQTGWAGFLYTTPESLRGRKLSSALAGQVRTAVVDEAHSVLREQGFRAEYARLGRMLDELNPLIRFACTATLPGRDRHRLIGSLGLADPEVITLPVARSNLSIHIVERDEGVLAQVLNHHGGEAGIIFAATVRTAEALHAKLRSQGRPIGLYHGRLTAKAKKLSQAAFRDGTTPMMVATDAFLLGIDKADIRFVAHYDYPKSIEDWVQGFGRAGRDDLPASVYGCFCGNGAREGRGSREFLINATYPAVADLRDVWTWLISAPFRDETAEVIATTVLGRRAKYSGGAILTQLKRHFLADASVNPEDKRKRIYRGRGDFDVVDWTGYETEAAETVSRFGQLGELVRLPENEIPAEIDRYFDGGQ